MTDPTLAAVQAPATYGSILFQLGFDLGTCGGQEVEFVVVSGRTPFGYRPYVQPSPTDAVAPLPAQEAPK